MTPTNLFANIPVSLPETDADHPTVWLALHFDANLDNAAKLP